VEIGLVEQSRHVDRPGIIGCDPPLCAGMFLRPILGSAVTDRHQAPSRVLSAAVRPGARAVADDLAGMRVIGGDDDQRVPVGLAKFQRDLHRPSRSTVSPIWLHGFASRSSLSIDAPSTCRKKPFGWFLSNEIALRVIAARFGAAAVRSGLARQVIAGLSILP
jgi:hypothetical protein